MTSTTISGSRLRRGAAALAAALLTVTGLAACGTSEAASPSGSGRCRRRGADPAARLLRQRHPRRRR